MICSRVELGIWFALVPKGLLAIPLKVWVIPGTSSFPSKPVNLNGVPTVNMFRADGGDDGAGESFVAFGNFRGWRATGFSARIQVFFTYDGLC